MTSPIEPIAPIETNAPAAPGAADWHSPFALLGPAFATRWPSASVPSPYWVTRNPALADELGLNATWFGSEASLNVFAGNAQADGSEPVASVYSGHQFGVWAGQLGDGRALLLGELNGLEVQLKGAGRTPYSRMGDGRAVLRSSVREFLCSEAMHALGIPTTRALCVVGSTLPVQREETETAAVLTRTAPSFLRFGHFEHFSQRERPAELLRLADFVIDRHYPVCRDAANPYAALLEQATLRTASLMADWQAVGFCHGVMNTDNMSILGLTIDYGPFGFLDQFDPGHICNHSDTQGRYAWARQPNVGFWNLHALAQGLMPLIEDSDLALAKLELYKEAFAEGLKARWRAKLGLRTAEPEDRELVDDLLRLMAADRSDFTITFRRLAGFVPGSPNTELRDLFIDREAFDAWGERYAARLALEASVDTERALRMNRANPKFILRNHLAEVAIREAQAGDFTETARLLKVLQRPFDESDDETSARYAGFPPDWARQIEVSCSS